MNRNARPSPPRTLVEDARAAIETCAVANARLAARRLTQFLNERMNASGVGVAQFALLAQIAATNDNSLGALAQRTGLDPSTLSRNLQVLERDGLVEIAIDEADSRRRAVWLTEQGARHLEAALAAWRRAHEELSAQIDASAVRRLAEATARLGDG